MTRLAIGWILVGVSALAALVVTCAFWYGRSVGFDEGVTASRRIHESSGRGAPADRAS